jgi:hypothetical protein
MMNRFEREPLTEEDINMLNEQSEDELENVAYDDGDIDPELLDKIGKIMDIEDVNERVKRWNKEFPDLPADVLKDKDE